jgi:hypothetical protein
MEMPALFRFVDPCLIWFYRITGHGLADFLIGTGVLALFAIIIGEFTLSLTFLILKKRIDHYTAKASKYQRLSLEALMEGDKGTYKAGNRLANDAFGKAFFIQIAMSAGFLWPAFFVLAWMDYHFAGLEFGLPFTDLTLGYIGVLILLYIPIYLVFRKLKYYLPYFRRIKTILDSYELDDQNLKGFAALRPLRPKPAAPDEA